LILSPSFSKLHLTIIYNREISPNLYLLQFTGDIGLVSANGWPLLKQFIVKFIEYRGNYNPENSV
jgi:hypothetical protein